MERFKNTLSVGAEKIAEEIQVSNQKEMSEVFNFIYSSYTNGDTLSTNEPLRIPNTP